MTRDIPPTNRVRGIQDDASNRARLCGQTRHSAENPRAVQDREELQVRPQVARSPRCCEVSRGAKGLSKIPASPPCPNPSPSRIRKASLLYQESNALIFNENARRRFATSFERADILPAYIRQSSPFVAPRWRFASTATSASSVSSLSRWSRTS